MLEPSGSSYSKALYFIMPDESQSQWLYLRTYRKPEIIVPRSEEAMSDCIMESRFGCTGTTIREDQE